MSEFSAIQQTACTMGVPNLKSGDVDCNLRGCSPSTLISDMLLARDLSLRCPTSGISLRFLENAWFYRTQYLQATGIMSANLHIFQGRIFAVLTNTSSRTYITRAAPKHSCQLATNTQHLHQQVSGASKESLCLSGLWSISYVSIFSGLACYWC